MKNSDKCPKCNSNDIIKIVGRKNQERHNNTIQSGWTIFSVVTVTRYLCGNCGYSEEWVENREDIAKLRNKFEK